MINDLDVLNKLSADNNQTLKAFPLSNARGGKSLKGGLGIIEMTVDQQTLINLGSNKLVGVLIVVDRDVFKSTKKEMQAGDRS